MRTRKLRESLPAYSMLLPSLIIVTLFLVYPILWSLLVSLNDVSFLDLRKAEFYQIPGLFTGLSNYQEILGNPIFWKALYNSLRFALVYIPLTLVLSMLFAIQMNRKIRGIKVFRTVIFSPYIISVVSASAIFLALFRSDKGIVNALLQFIGINSPAWLSDERLAMPVISIMSAWKKTGYYMLIFLTGLQAIPTEVLEAAEVDGVNETQKTLRIYIPLLSKMASLSLVLMLIDVLRVFAEPYVMTGGGPQNSTLTVPLLIFNEAFTYMHVGTAAAMSYMLLLITLVLVFLQNLLKKRYADF